MSGEHSGHRQRLIEKLDKGGLYPHELLELFLFNGMPRKNTNPLAHRLLAEFGSIRNVFSASEEQLERVEGVGKNLAAYIAVVGKMMRIISETEDSSLPKTFERESFLPFVKQEYEGMPYEVFDMYFLDAEGRIFSRKRFSSDNVASVQLSLEELSANLSQEKTSGVVLVHNHPSGDAKPSEMDDYTTKKCQTVCSFHNVVLCDHIIYSDKGLYSYYGSGRLQEISCSYSVENLLQDKAMVQKEK